MIETDYPILATKLYIPKPSPALVRRRRLTESLSTCIQRKLTLISAPAGFGKTTLLSEWIVQSQLPVIWISLDSSDNDPVYFIKYLIAALQAIEPELGRAASTMLQSPQQTAFDIIVMNLIREIEDISEDFVLVLDDYHAIDTVKIHQLVERLIDRMPPQMHLVVATRVDPNLPLSRLRVRNQLNEFRASDLVFTMDETAQFFNKVMNLDLSNQDIEKLDARTEGWIAGLQLAALSMQGRSDISGFIKAFAGDDRLIVDYLAEEVLNRQPLDIQNFLLKTSILNRLSEPLCDCVTNQKGSRKILENLEKANLFLVPLDNKRNWYRYHHLFADLLRHRLYQKLPDVVSRLHNRASEWFDANDFKEDAVEHALTAKNFKRAIELIEAYIEMKWHGGQQVMLFKWLDQLPDEFKLGKPDLGICHARFLLESGRQENAEKLIDQLEKSYLNIPKTNHDVLRINAETLSDSEATALKGRIAAIKSYLVSRKGDIDDIAEYSRQARIYLSSDDLVWQSIVAMSSGMAHHVKGDSIEALKAHSEAVACAKEAGNVYFYLMAQIRRIIEMKNTGRLPEAKNICQALFGEINERIASFNFALAHVNGVWSEILYELNELGEALDFSEKSVAVLEQGHDVSVLGWRYCCLMRILCSMGNIAGAKEIARKTDRLMQDLVIPPWITSKIRAAKAKILLIEGNLDALKQWEKECALKLDEDNIMLRECEYIMFSRLLLAQGQIEDALVLLDRLLTAEEKGGRVIIQIENLLIQSLAFKQQRNLKESMAAVQKALSLAEPGGCVRVFIDEGPSMAELLETILDQKPDIPSAFVKKLLPAFKIRRIKESDDGLVEQLSDRELEVLRFIAAGLSNKKITEELFVSLSTVKTHLRNIYGKLDVHSRTEAIVKAKELGLLN